MSAHAQERPLSVIDWLSNSLDLPAEVVTPEDIAQSVITADINVRALDAPNVNSIGLLSPSVSGLPANIWGASNGDDLARLIMNFSARPEILATNQRLLNRMILSELDPPNGDSSSLFIARIDTLLKQGRLEEANAMLDIAGNVDAEVFRRNFDTKLLLGIENTACEDLTSFPGFAPSSSARVFCLARAGRWTEAALTLNAAETLGLINEKDAYLLARFLDPELFEGEPSTPFNFPPSPLVFRLKEAIGETIPTSNLPVAFAHTELSERAGWRAQVLAAERLARNGALSANEWIGVWTKHIPSASGGIWDRVDVLQRFEIALNSGDPSAVSSILPETWDVMRVSRLQHVFADHFAPKIIRLPLTQEAKSASFEVAAYSKNYENALRDFTPENNLQAFMRAIAIGDITFAPSDLSRPIEIAIFDAFLATKISSRLQTLTEQNRVGEAILLAMSQLENGAQGELDELKEAIVFFNLIGLKDTARRAALEVLLDMET